TPPEAPASAFGLLFSPVSRLTLPTQRSYHNPRGPGSAAAMSLRKVKIGLPASNTRFQGTRTRNVTSAGRPTSQGLEGRGHRSRILPAEAGLPSAGARVLPEVGHRPEPPWDMPASGSFFT